LREVGVEVREGRVVGVRLGRRVVERGSRSNLGWKKEKGRSQRLAFEK